MLKPSPADLEKVIAEIESGRWYDIADHTATNWNCNLFENGAFMCNGSGRTPREAMAYAWINTFAPDALINNSIDGYDVPLTVTGDEWHFEILRPGEPWSRPKDRIS